MTQPIYNATQLYRRLHLGGEFDIDFYLKAAIGSTHILELGCGWGRLSLPLAKAGYHVTAVDLESEYLDELKLESQSTGLTPLLSIQRQDIRNLDLRDKSGCRAQFDRIIIPYNTLYALGGSDEVKACLLSAANHLEKDGELWFDLYSMDSFHEQYDVEDDDVIDDEPVASWDSPAGAISVFEKTEVHHHKQRLIVDYEARLGAQGHIVGKLKVPHDYLLTTQLETLLGEAGLKLRGQYESSTLRKHSAAHALDEDADTGEDSGPVFYVATGLETD